MINEGLIVCVYCGEDFFVDDINAVECKNAFETWECPYCKKDVIIGNGLIISKSEFKKMFWNKKTIEIE